MRRLLRDTLRGLIDDDNNRQAPAQANQAAPRYGGNVPPPQGSPVPGIWPPPGTPTGHLGHLPPSGASGYASRPPAHGMGVPQPPGIPYQSYPGPAGSARPYYQGQMAGIPVTDGPPDWLLQAMPPQGPQPAMVSPPAMLPKSSAATQQAMTRGALPNMPIADTSNAFNSQAGSSALALQVRHAPQAKPGQFYCRWCDKCKRGLAYGTLSFICISCRYWLCPGCSEVHRQAHKQYVRARLWQWGAAPRTLTEAVSLCVVCAPVKEVQARIQCKHCSYALCLPCSGSPAALSKFLTYHNIRHMTQGKTMDIELLVVYPEGWFVTETRGVQPCPCQERPTTAIMHCQRCHILIEIGQHVQWCRGCYSDWGINQWLCGNCFEEELQRGQQGRPQLGMAPENQQGVPEEKHKHDFVKTLIMDDPSGPDTRKEAICCRICKIWLATEKDRNSHFHAHVNTNTDIVMREAYLNWKITPRLLEAYRQALHKKCDMERTLREQGQPS